MAVRGGKRDGSGRKPKADEIKLIEEMDSIATPKDAWEKLWVLCETGDVQALKTWISYRFGLPKQSMDIKVSDPLIFKLPTKDGN